MYNNQPVELLMDMARCCSILLWWKWIKQVVSLKIHECWWICTPGTLSRPTNLCGLVARSRRGESWKIYSLNTLPGIMTLTVVNAYHLQVCCQARFPRSDCTWLPAGLWSGGRPSTVVSKLSKWDSVSQFHLTNPSTIVSILPPRSRLGWTRPPGWSSATV